MGLFVFFVFFVFVRFFVFCLFCLFCLFFLGFFGFLGFFSCFSWFSWFSWFSRFFRFLRTVQCEKCEVKCFDEKELKHHMESNHSGPKPCRYGDHCKFLAEGRCKFSHRMVVEEGWEEVHRRGRKVPNKQRIPVQPCKYDELCTKGRFCAFTHTRWRSAMPTQSAGSRFQFNYNMEEDFPVLSSINRKYQHTIVMMMKTKILMTMMMKKK